MSFVKNGTSTSEIAKFLTLSALNLTTVVDPDWKNAAGRLKFIANKRLKDIGLEALYEGFTVNPYLHLDKISDTNGEGNVKGNFFEANVSSYNQSTAVEGWEDI